LFSDVLYSYESVVCSIQNIVANFSKQGALAVGTLSEMAS